MDVDEQIKIFRDFIEQNYYPQLLETVRKGHSFIVLDFSELIKFNSEISEELLENPEELLKAAELAIKEFDLPKKLTKFTVRLKNLPESQTIMISEIRSKNLTKLITVEGIVRQKSDVRPHVKTAKFECPSCGNILSVLQLDTKYKEPTRCGCGRKGKFKEISRELVDGQGLVLEESPDNLDGAQSKRMNVFLKDDLVSPLSERRSNPGARVRVIGWVTEVPITLRTGGRSTKYDLIIEANFIEPLEDDMSNTLLTPEEKVEIEKIAHAPNCLHLLAKSIAPSIYGHDKIKEALVLQLAGGCRKVRPDGAITRGDIHTLLIGDPGCIAGSSMISLYHKGMKPIQSLGKKHLQPLKELVTKIRKGPKDLPYDYTSNFQIYKNQATLKLVTETGKSVVCTYNQPFLTKEGWKRADELMIGEKIRVMPRIPNHIKAYKKNQFTKLKTKSHTLKKSIKLPERVTPNLASLYGYILGDGNIHPNGYRVACYINEEEKDLIPKLKTLWKDLFNTNVYMYKGSGTKEKTIIDKNKTQIRTFISSMPVYRMEINSKLIASNLSFLKEKRVPKVIFESPLDVISKFLSWLFEADGCTFSTGRGKTSVQLKSVYVDLLKGVQLLLLYYGIQSRIIEDNLSIRRSREIKLFADKIGFVSEKKIKKLAKTLEEIEKKSDQQKRKVPQRYEKVALIEAHEIIDVYDFEVPKSKCFIANGIVCHNSGKSQLLKRISVVAPKARFTSGKGASLDYKEPIMIKEKGLVKIKKIGDLVEENCVDKEGVFLPFKKDFRTLAFNPKTLKLEWKKIDFGYKHKTKELLYEIELETGRSVVVTGDHSIFDVEEGNLTCKEASKLKKGDTVIIPSTIKHKGKIKNKSIACLLGYFIAEGNARSKDGSYQIQFTLHKKEAAIVKDIEICSKKLFDKMPRVYKKRDKGITVVLHGKEIHNKFKRWLGSTYGKRAKEKRIPDIVFNMERESQKEFIRAYIKGDAGVTKSEGLMSDLLYLYLSKNIIASCNKREDTRPRKIANRVIKAEGLRYDLKAPHPNKKYNHQYKSIPLTALDKEIRDDHCKSIISSKYCRFNWERISHKKIVERILFIGNNQGVSGPVLTKKYPKIVMNYILKNPKLYIGIKRGRTKYIYLTNKGKNLYHKLNNCKFLSESDFGYCRVKNIKRVKSTNSYVYDVSIKGFENFVAGFGGIICHNTAAGLTASVVKDEFLGGWSLEAGTLVLANRGFAIIDEMDKMGKEDRSALHEAMEQQQVSIAKANIQATLRCETSLLAAANPKFGRFDPYDLIANQINLPPTLINRFDLIFPVKDLPNREKDEKLASFILSSHRNPEKVLSDIPTDLLKKYFAYIRQKVNPQISEEAIEEIKTYYVGMRNSGNADEAGIKSVPITARQLEALVRLSEASAKLKLAKTVTKEDAQKAIELVDHCLNQIARDAETGKIDIDRLSSRITATQRGSISVVKEIIHALEEQLQAKIIPVEQIVEAAQEKNLLPEKVEEVLEKLRRSGDIFEPKRGFVQRL
ncbi:MAG: ATP-binding protein [Nanoarchaeota archaeon]|nr:ATP-binding protein [Nanoarchaeota archaeon]